MTTTNLTTALSALSSEKRIINLLSPGGAASAAVSDIIAAAGGVISLSNTTNSALASFSSRVNDPIAASFSTGQPYGGTFITAPTTSQMNQINFNQSASSSTRSLSQLSTAQQLALAEQTGIALVTDADLAIALATNFARVQNNFKLAFSVNISDNSTIVPIVTTDSTTPEVITIPSLTTSPNINEISSFVSDAVTSFPNVTGIAGVAASVWVGNLGVVVSGTGTPISGIPSNIDGGVYGDITAAASGMITLPTVTVVDYSTQQNKFNLVVALTIDNGLVTTFNTLMTSDLVNSATIQVIKNRLNSVAQRGDVAMISAMITNLGINNTPSIIPLLTILLSNLNPSDQTNSSVLSTIVASGIPITTTTTQLSTTELLAGIRALLTLFGVTIIQICSQSTGGVVFDGMTVLNTKIMNKINRPILKTLLDATTVDLSLMW